MSQDHELFVKADFTKVDESLGLVFGYALVCKENGEDYYDLQGDHVPEESMLKALVEFMEHSRTAKEMHEGDKIGDVVFAFPLTSEISASMEIQTKRTGAIIAMKPSPDVLEKYKSGEYTGFSIGGIRLVDEDV